MAEIKSPAPPTLQTIRRLIPDLKIHKTWLWLVWLTALIAGVMEFISPYLLQSMTDTALAQQSEAFRQLVSRTDSDHLFDD